VGWLAAFTVGVWCPYVWRAGDGCVVATVQRGADEPGARDSEEVLAEHRTDDRPIVQAFQEAVDAGEAEETASVA